MSDEKWDDAPRATWSADVLVSCGGGWSKEEPRLVLRGNCPVCGDYGISEWLPLHPVAVGAGGRFAAAPEGDAPPPVPTRSVHREFVRCQCTKPHADRPSGEKGCGARGLVDVVEVPS